MPTKSNTRKQKSVIHCSWRMEKRLDPPRKGSPFQSMNFHITCETRKGVRRHLASGSSALERNWGDEEQIFRLIAAAPELLNAALAARDVLATAIRANWEGATDSDIANHVTIKRLDRAIEKATGADHG